MYMHMCMCVYIYIYIYTCIGVCSLTSHATAGNVDTRVLCYLCPK